MKNLVRTVVLFFAATLTLTSCGDDKELYTIMVNSNNSAWGTVYGGGKYEAGTTIQIAATPVTGYKFARWNDDNTDNPRNIVVNADAAYTAIFEDINGNDPGTDPGTDPGYDTIPHDSTSHAWITFGDTTWSALTVVKQTGGAYHQLSLMADENAEGPTMSFTFPGTEGTFTPSNSNILSVYYMEHGFNDLVEVNGQQYPRWLAVGNFTVNIIEYNLNAGYVTCTIEADLLNMEREAQGLSQEFRHLTVDIEKMYYLNYSK